MQCSSDHSLNFLIKVAISRHLPPSQGSEPQQFLSSLTRRVISSKLAPALGVEQVKAD